MDFPPVHCSHSPLEAPRSLISLNEAETRAKLIDPAIKVVGWTEEHIRREETAGRIAIIRGKAVRARSGRTDYTLRLVGEKQAQPVAVAVIEAKAEAKHPSHGLEQSKLYARSKLLNTPFVFATNGHLFVEYDRFTGLTTEARPLAEFPTPGELWSRYEIGMGFKLTDEAAKPLITPYAASGEQSRRYYQDAAIRAVFEKLAKADQPKRALLSLATGAGKTFLAAHLLRRLADSPTRRLRPTPQGALHLRPHRAPRTGCRCLARPLRLECRGGEGRPPGKECPHPRRHLPRFPRAPTANDLLEDQRLLADNLRHFGEPVYEYDLAQAMEDGYLAACEIRKRDIFLDRMPDPEHETGLRRDQLAAKKLRDPITGRAILADELEDRYNAVRFEGILKLPDRVKALAADLFVQLLTLGGPEQKTVIFCAGDPHADDIATAMNNEYAAWCRKTGRPRVEPYAFKCTGASDGNDLLPDFKGSRTHHFIATTVDLISTGVDVPGIRNIVFARYLRSPILFYQMIGRGTRIDASTGKLMFRVWDYTNATRLFGEEFITAPASEPGEEGGGTPGPIKVEARGISVEILDGGTSLVAEVDGKAMPVSVADYKVKLAAALLLEAPDLPAFVAQWIDPARREELIAHLPESGTSAEQVRLVSRMEDYDLYDVLAQLAYAAPARTRLHRVEAFAAANADWLAALGDKTEAVLLALVNQFVDSGTDGLEMRDLFKVREVRRAGGLAALQAHEHPGQLVMETKRRLFVA